MEDRIKELEKRIEELEKRLNHQNNQTAPMPFVVPHFPAQPLPRSTPSWPQCWCGRGYPHTCVWA